MTCTKLDSAPKGNHRSTANANGSATSPQPGARRLLVINSNTSPSISNLLQHHAQSQAGAHVYTRTVTARFGAPYIADEASYAVAAHATLDAWAAALASDPVPPDTVLIGCFGDPGLAALRLCSPAPVTGLAEASFIAAARLGRFAVVTGGRAWEPILHRLAVGSGFGAQLAAICAVELHGDQLAADRPRALRLLTEACHRVIVNTGVESVILGGAGVTGIAAAIQADIAIPVIDSLQAGVALALALVPGTGQRTTPGFDTPWHNLSPDMMRLGTTPG